MQIKNWIYPIIGLLFLNACSTPIKNRINRNQLYQNALKTTDAGQVQLMEPDSATVKRAMAQFIEFYQDYSHEKIQKNVRNLYAENAFFADPFKTVEGIDEIENYFLESTDTIESCTFDIQDVANHKGNYYFRWWMDLTLKRYKDRPMNATGMSHVRYNKEGKIIFQQDYWDVAGTVYEKIPILGSVLKKIRNRI